MPCYPAMALLLGSAMVAGGKWITRGTRALMFVTGLGGLVVILALVAVRHVPTPGDISAALTQQATYKLSLSHMSDLTLQSMAYLRLPLAVALAALCTGLVGTLMVRGQAVFVVPALMMILFYQAARLAMVDFDPYLSSRPLAEALLRSPDGILVTNRHYYPFSSLFFYTNRSGLLLNGRVNNLVYGSYAPKAPNVFIDDERLRALWLGYQRVYLAAPDNLLPHLSELLAPAKVYIVKKSGGRALLTNQSIPQ